VLILWFIHEGKIRIVNLEEFELYVNVNEELKVLSVWFVH